MSLAYHTRAGLETLTVTLSRVGGFGISSQFSTCLWEKTCWPQRPWASDLCVGEEVHTKFSLNSPWVCAHVTGMCTLPMFLADRSVQGPLGLLATIGLLWAEGVC